MRRALAFAPAAAWALLILWLGSLADLAPPIDTELPIDKLGHFAVFAVLGVLLARALRRADLRVSLTWPLLFGVGVGTLDELNQRNVAGRTADAWDLVADAAGVAFGLWLTRRLLARRDAATPAHVDEGPASPASQVQEHRA